VSDDNGSPQVRLTILTPDEIVLDTDVTSLRFQQQDGWRGILANHTPFITALVNGTLLYRLPGDPTPHYVALYGGTLEVKKEQIIILTAAAEPGDDVQELAQHLLERQAEADALAFEAYIEYTKVRTALVRALTDLPEPLDAIR
jgi:F-type H+-transporting ATPase subunit epsilon